MPGKQTRIDRFEEKVRTNSAVVLRTVFGTEGQVVAQAVANVVAVKDVAEPTHLVEGVV